MKTFLRQAAGQTAGRGSFDRGRLPGAKRTVFYYTKLISQQKFIDFCKSSLDVYDDIPWPKPKPEI
jgi:hypothetical protein